MVYSDTTNKDGILQRIEDYTNLGDGVISGDTTLRKKITSRVNEVCNEMMLAIMESQDNFDWDDPTRTDFPIATTPLVAGQRDYQFDGISFLRIKRMDITWDGSTWYRATPFDSASYHDGFGNDDTVDGNFSKTEPMYDPKSFGFWLYPRATAADVALGAKARIEYVRSFDEYTQDDTTKEAPFAAPFQELMAIGAAMKYLIIKGDAKAGNLRVLYEEGMERLRKFYGRRDTDFQLVFNPQIQTYD